MLTCIQILHTYAKVSEVVTSIGLLDKSAQIYMLTSQQVLQKLLVQVWSRLKAKETH